MMRDTWRIVSAHSVTCVKLRASHVGIIATIRWTYFNCHFNFIKQTKGHSY